MKPNLPQRKNLRLIDFDYSLPGAYFVTICTRDSLFLIDPAPVRAMVQKWWEELSRKFGNVELDEFIIMPNHVHGIIVLKEPAHVRGDLCVAPTGESNPGGHAGPPLHDGGVIPIPTIIQWFKTMTTNDYMHGVKQNGWRTFPGKLWQRNYYEHIIRNDREYEAIRLYIRDNPIQWAYDRENPANISTKASETASDYLADIH